MNEKLIALFESLANLGETERKNKINEFSQNYIDVTKYRELEEQHKNLATKYNQIETETKNKKQSEIDELTQLKNEIVELKRDKNKAHAAKIFMENGIKTEVYSDFINGIDLSNYDVVDSLVNNVVKMIGTTQKNVEKDNIIKGQLPDSVVGNVQKTMTKEEFDRLSTLQRVELLENNPTLYNELTNN